MLHPLALAVLAYAWWGFVPAYWMQLPGFRSWEMIAWRVVFSLLSLLPFLARPKYISGLREIFASRRMLLGCLCTSLLIGFNWSLYIWAVTNGHIVESSLGYFLNPLLNMALGTLLLKERMSRLQQLACTLAAVGVAWLTLQTGTVPWIALLLAGSFAGYGLGRKVLRLPTLPATFVETACLFPPAIVALFVLHSGGALHAGVASPKEWLVLSLCGLITTIPLLAFAEAAMALPLTVLGFIQFLSPSFQFLLGVFVYKEPFASERWLSFSLIWLGLLLFLANLARSSGFTCSKALARK